MSDVRRAEHSPRENADSNIFGVATADGKELILDVEKLGVKGVLEEVARHSRILTRQEALNGN